MNQSLANPDPSDFGNTTPTVPLAGIVQSEAEISAAESVLRSTWHAPGRQCVLFQQEIAAYAGVSECVVLNSGSAANLASLLALCLSADSKVLTSGVGFPATLSPIVHAGLEPVLVDFDIRTHNISLEQIECALSIDPKIRAILVAHTLGFPIDMDRLMSICNMHDVLLIEDCCEALGSRYAGRVVGSFGAAASWSFYPSHQISALGSGGAALLSTRSLADHVRSLRDWGKVPIGEGEHTTSLSCMVDGIPYDAQYAYQTIGFNMRLPDICCAYGRIQLQRLNDFNTVRRRNYLALQSGLEDLPLLFPAWPEKAEPAFFAMPLTLQEGYDRNKLVKHLEASGVRTRLFFAGNITRHPPFARFRKDFPVGDYLMEHSLLVGCWHGLTPEQINWTIKCVRQFFTRHTAMQ